MDRKADFTLDLRGTPCPMNWVEAKLQLEQMKPGQLLEMLLDEGEPMRSVPMSVRTEGHKIVDVKWLDGAVQIVVERV